MLVLVTSTARVKEAVALCETASVTLAVKENDPVFEGLPLSVPEALSDTPAGSDPAEMLHA